MRLMLFAILGFLLSCNSTPDNIAIDEEYKRQQFYAPSIYLVDQKKSIAKNLDSIDSWMAESFFDGKWLVFVDSFETLNGKTFERFAVDTTSHLKKYLSQVIIDKEGNSESWVAKLLSDTVFHFEIQAFNDKSYQANVTRAEAYFLPDTTIILGTVDYQKLLWEKKKLIMDTIKPKLTKKYNLL